MTGFKNALLLTWGWRNWGSIEILSDSAHIQALVIGWTVFFNLYDLFKIFVSLWHHRPGGHPSERMFIRAGRAYPDSYRDPNYAKP